MSSKVVPSIIADMDSRLCQNMFPIKETANNISEGTLIKAVGEFLRYLSSEQIAFDVDEFSEASHAVFTKQETEYLSGQGFWLFSILTLAFLQLGIIEVDESL